MNKSMAMETEELSL